MENRSGQITFEQLWGVKKTELDVQDDSYDKHVCGYCKLPCSEWVNGQCTRKDSCEFQRIYNEQKAAKKTAE
jgi:hypothetical protein